MIPDTISDEANLAEQNIFEKLKQAPTEWLVFHSVYVKQTKSPWTNEIDFVILISEPKCYSVICLEVKGDRYIIRERQWFRNKNSRTPEKVSPPDEAKKSMNDLVETFGSYFKGPARLSLGCAVAFPDMELKDRTSPTHVAKMWFRSDVQDSKSLVDSLRNYAQELHDFNLDKLKKRDPRNIEDIQAEQQIALDKLRNDLECNMEIMPPSQQTISHSDLEDLRPHLLRLTTDQSNCLRCVNLNKHFSWVIDGAAGTGKTVLAMELARQRCEAGKTVALLCSNPNLSRRFEIWAETLPNDNGGKVVAGTPATLPAWAFSNASTLIQRTIWAKIISWFRREEETLIEKHQQRLDAPPNLEESLKSGDLKDKWESFIDETIKDLGQGNIFDYLIVDEAQNLCDEVFLKLMDVLLKGGLDEGHWTMFGDFTNQNLVASRLTKDKEKKALKDFDPDINLAYNSLTTNCRNTHEIADEFLNLVGIESPPLSGVHGPEVQFEYFKSQTDLDKLLACLVTDLQRRKFACHQIILLSSDNDTFNTKRKYGKWQLFSIDEKGTMVLEGENDPLNVSVDAAPLRYSDIYDFQGLESDVAILILPVTADQTVTAGSATLPYEKRLNRMLYTGMSRAKAILIVVSHESYRKIIERRRNTR